MEGITISNKLPDSLEIDFLSKLIEVADYSNNARIDLLFALGFAAKGKKFYRLNNLTINVIDEYLNPTIALILILVLLIAVFKSTQLTVAGSILAALSAYSFWIRNQRSKNVDDALKRKDMANAMIVQNKELLIPYAGNVFDFEAKYAEQILTHNERVTIDMYVFAEIDNLEFVFEKSRARLIEDKYVVRAIKIFVTRAQNEGFFNVAKRLISIGRYNEDFARAVIKLLYVGRSYTWNLK